MAYFDARNGWFHLAFYEDQDYYYLPSLAKVGAWDYLINQLRAAGYQILLTMEYLGEEACFEGLDEASKAFAEEKLSATKKTLFFKGKNSFENKCKEIFGAPQKVAIITKLLDYEKIFADDANYNAVKECIKSNQNYRSIMVATAPLMAEGSNYLFLDSNSAVNRQHEAVRQAVKSSEGFQFHLYEALKNSFAERCVFLNDMSKEMLRSTVTRNFQLDCGDESAQSLVNDIDSVVDVLYDYYHLPYSDLITSGFLAIGLTQNGDMKTAVLDADLKKPALRKNLVAFAREYVGGSGRFYVNRCPMYTHSNRLASWKQLEAELSRVDNGVDEVEADLRKIRECLQNLALRGDNERMKQGTENMMDAIRKSISSPQGEFRAKMIAALRQYLEFSYDGDEQWREGVWKLCEAVRDSADQGQIISDNVNKCRKHLAQAEAEWRKADEFFAAGNGSTGELARSADSMDIYKSIYDLREAQLNAYQGQLEQCKENMIIALQDLETSRELNLASIASSVDTIVQKKIRIGQEIMAANTLEDKIKAESSRLPEGVKLRD